MISRLTIIAAGALAGLCGLSGIAQSAQIAETYQVNLDPLIDAAVRHRTQFAVNVARRIDSESSGRWLVDRGNATWDYSMKIPTAVSMGFHASRLMLPSQGVMTISGGGRSITYHGGDLHRADFWSRTVPGDQVAVRISVPARLRHQALIQIAAFQAGYRSLAPGLADNAHFRALQGRTSSQSSGSCVQNYVCDATAATQTSADASVAIVISNQFECSGTLLNDVPQDGAPYVLTARHCENGEDGGGDPGAASSVQIYWNSVTPCGQTLASIFDSYSQVQSGATTVVEQQDEWLIQLDAQPTYSAVYYAGWDASGAALDGGYSVDYSSADTQQYVTWAGAAITENLSAQTLGVGYASTYWGVVNSLGSVDHGASGSGLFNGNNLIVGSASLANPAQCPANPPPAPTTNTVVALYNQLASTWNSTADASSTTGLTTLASVLDPAHSGATVLPGVAGPPPSAVIQASQSSAQTGLSIDLQFEGSSGAVCTATGGSSGDGWSGTLNAYPAGTVSVTEANPGSITYGMTCVSGSRSMSAQVTVTWSLAAPMLTLYDQVFPVGLVAGLTNPLIWQSNQASCVASGGSAGDGWGGTLAGSGQIDVIENQPGTYVYSLTCGAGTQSISQSLTLVFAAPAATLSVVAESGLHFGQNIALDWTGSGECTASGGAAGDGWAGPLASTGVVYLTEQAAGTYTYTISCGPSAVAAVAHATYSFAGGPATAVLTATQPTQLIDLSVETYPALLTWTSNLEPCSIDYTGPVSGTLLSGYQSQGADTQPQQIAGLYTYVLTCGYGGTQATSTATIEWTQQPVPRVTLTTEHSNEFLVSGGYLAWTTNVLPCIGSGGTAGDGWDGTLPYYGGPGNFSAALISEPAGTYTFTVTCGVGNTASASATAVYNNAGGGELTLTPGLSQVLVGQPTYLTWNSAVAPCTGYGGTSGDGWNGSLPQKGTASVIEPLGNDYILSLVCGVGSAAVEAQSEVIITGYASQVSVSLGSSSSASAVGHAVTLNWTGNQAASCTATGGMTGDGWTGSLPWYGSMTVVEAQAGSVSYGLTCQNGALSGQGSLTVQWVAAPTVALTSSTQKGVFGTPLTLTWSAANGATGCTAAEDGGQIGQWNGSVADAGSQSITESSGSSHTYSITCSSSYGNVQAQVTVSFSAPSSTGSGSSGSTGSSGDSGSGSGSGSSGRSGGGDLDPEMIGVLAFLTTIRARRRPLRPEGRPTRLVQSMSDQEYQ